LVMYSSTSTITLLRTRVRILKKLLLFKCTLVQLKQPVSR